MTNNQPTSSLATVDARCYFERAFVFGVQKGLIDNAKLAAIETDAIKGIVQIATTFGSPYLRAEIELAKTRIVNLVNLYLSHTYPNDLEKAARIIRDNTFLTLSRGGSTLLKTLFALPEYPILGHVNFGRVEDFLEMWSRQISLEDYVSMFEQRKQYQRDIKLAQKIALHLEIDPSQFNDQLCEAQSLLRSALIIGMQKGRIKAQENPLSPSHFMQVLTHLRDKGIATKSKLLSDDELILQENELQLLTTLQKNILQFDAPKIADATIKLDVLMSQFRERYFVREAGIEDSAGYEAYMSDEWRKVTKGKTDIDAMLTLLLCVAADAPKKVSLTQASAKALIKKLHKNGFNSDVAEAFIEQYAPHEMQDDLLADWRDFYSQAQHHLFDVGNDGMQNALRFLSENCYVEGK